MRKFLGFLLVLAIVIGGGAYFYLTKIFPEAQVVAMIEDFAGSTGGTASYESLEPGPLGLDGTIDGIVIENPGSPPVRIESFYYQIDPVWVLTNLPFLFEYRTLTHYKVLDVRGLEYRQSADLLSIASTRIEDFDATKLAKKELEAKASQSTTPTLEDLDFALDDVTFSRFAISDVTVSSPQGSASLNTFELADLSRNQLGKLRLEALNVDVPQGTIRLDRIDGKNIQIPESVYDPNNSEPSFRSADKFEIAGIHVTSQGTDLFELEQILYQESDPRNFEGLGQIATDVRFDIRGVTVPAEVFAASPELLDFLTVSQMSSLTFDFLNHSTIDLGLGLSESTVLFAARELFELNAGLTLGGFNETFFQSMSDVMSTIFADAFKAIWTTDFTAAQQFLPATSEEAEAMFMAALSALSLNQFSIGYADRSLIQKLENYLVYSGAAPEEARDIMTQGAYELALQTHGTPIAQELTAGVYSMVQNPGRFTVIAIVDPPLTLGEVIGAAEAEDPMTVAQNSFAERLQVELVIE